MYLKNFTQSEIADTKDDVSSVSNDVKYHPERQVHRDWKGHAQVGLGGETDV